MSEYKLWLGDCLQFMKTMDAGSVTACITDPPYNSGLDYGDLVDDNRPSDEYWAWMSVIVKELERVSSLVIVKHSALKIYEWTHAIKKSRMIIWYKSFSSGFPVNGFATHFEPLWVVCGKSAHWSKDVIEYTSGNRPEDGKHTGHPAQMPLGFISRLLNITTHIGDTIFDPFMGSGTTGVACMQLGRNFIGCEISEEYFKIAERRIYEASLQPPLFTDASPTPDAQQGELWER